MVKSYLRFSQKHIFGLINSSVYGAGVLLDAHAKFAISPVLESIAIYSISQGLLIKLLQSSGKASVVTKLVLNFQRTLVAAGYHDGSIKI